MRRPVHVLRAQPRDNGIPERSPTRRPASVTAVLLAILLGGCATTGATQATGDTVTTPAAAPDPETARLIAHGTQLAQTGHCDRAMSEALAPALALFERAHRADPSPPRASRVVNSGSVSSLGTDAAGASSPPTLGPEWSDTMYLQAFCLVDAGRSTEAVALLERALTLIPDDVVYACELGHVRQEEGRFEEAMTIFRGALENARTLERSGALSRALLFGQPLGWWTRRALRGVGFSLIELGRLPEADAVYRQVLVIDPTDERAIQELQLIATRRGAI